MTTVFHDMTVYFEKTFQRKPISQTTPMGCVPAAVAMAVTAAHGEVMGKNAKQLLDPAASRGMHFDDAARLLAEGLAIDSRVANGTELGTLLREHSAGGWIVLEVNPSVWYRGVGDSRHAVFVSSCSFLGPEGNSLPEGLKPTFIPPLQIVDPIEESPSARLRIFEDVERAYNAGEKTALIVTVPPPPT